MLGRISSLADGDKYPSPTEFVVADKFTVSILPRGERPTKIPEHLTEILKTNFMYAIRVKITRYAMATRSRGASDDSDDVMIVREEKLPTAASLNKV